MAFSRCVVAFAACYSLITSGYRVQAYGRELAQAYIWCQNKRASREGCPCCLWLLAYDIMPRLGAQAYGRELAEAYEWCQKTRASRKGCTFCLFWLAHRWLPCTGVWARADGGVRVVPEVPRQPRGLNFLPVLAGSQVAAARRRTGASWRRRTSGARSTAPAARRPSCTRPGTCTTTCSSASTSSCPRSPCWSCSTSRPRSSAPRRAAQPIIPSRNPQP